MHEFLEPSNETVVKETHQPAVPRSDEKCESCLLNRVELSQFCKIKLTWNITNGQQQMELVGLLGFRSIFKNEALVVLGASRTSCWLCFCKGSKPLQMGFHCGLFYLIYSSSCFFKFLLTNTSSICKSSLLSLFLNFSALLKVKKKMFMIE